jgi:polysaccharide chain length determinant protein (PEP-CTERM system associated)
MIGDGGRMKTQKKSVAMPVEATDFSLTDYLDLVWRRKGLVLLFAILGAVIAVGYSYVIPPLYRSTTLILVEPQKIPPSYVNSTVTSSVEDRLSTISQQILSRTNLEKIIQDFALYKPDVAGPEGLERLKAWGGERWQEVLTTLGLFSAAETAPWEPSLYVEHMREAVEISVMGGRNKNAFSITYSGPEPQTVMQVTNALAALFIEENLKVRERQAEGTSEFLASELAAAEKELQTFEAQLKTFKEHNQGALPEQLETNLRTLDRLQLELQTLNEGMRNAEERKQFYTQQQQLANAAQGEAPEEAQESPPVPGPAVSDPRQAELDGLRRELARLQAQFHDNYPDILVLKNRLSELEAQIAATPPPSMPVPSAQRPRLRQSPASTATRGAQFHEQIHSLNTELRTLRERQQRVLAQLAEYERRIEKTHENELKLFTLTRDYGISKNNYEALLSKKLSAKMSENLEKKQKGEQFKIIDPADFPKFPYKPERPRIILIGTVVGLGLGFALAFVLENVRAAFRKPEEVQGSVGYPVLVSIPHNQRARKERSWRLVSMEEVDSFATEQYRVLYAKLADLSMEKGHQVFAISSALPEDGKTVTTLNLAVVMARDFGKRTLLLEGDLRNPTISHYLDLELGSGLVDILSSKTSTATTLIPFADTLVPFADERLAVLPAVKRARNSSGLLSSQRMRDLLHLLKSQYDFILVDTPPILPLSDMQIFAEVVDGVLLVVRAEHTPKAALLQAIQKLGTEKLVGIVLNDVALQGMSPYAYAYGKA